MNIEIKDFSHSHKLCIVTNRRGYSYCCLWAMEKDKDGKVVTSPTIEQVRQAYKEDKNDFQPYKPLIYAPYC